MRSRKREWFTLLFLLFSFLCCSSAFSFVSITVYDSNDGKYLGDVSELGSTIAYRESLLFKVMPTTPTDKVRLEPLNTECGSDWQTDDAGPFEFTIEPLSASSKCELQIVGWQSPWKWVGSYLFSIDFNDAGQPMPVVNDVATKEFALLELYNLDTGEYLGVVEDGVATIPFAEVIGVSIDSSEPLDWVRLIPNNEYCGKQRRFDNKPPFQLKVFAEAESLACEFTIQGLQKPRELVGAVDVLLVFTNELLASDVVQPEIKNVIEQ